MSSKHSTASAIDASVSGIPESSVLADPPVLVLLVQIKTSRRINLLLSSRNIAGSPKLARCREAVVIERQLSFRESNR